jgi:ATP-dependent DNA ligase
MHFLKNGYEGGIIRHYDGLYTYSLNGKRSNDVFKCKIRMTLEVNVIRYTHGKGKDTDCIIWICKYDGCNEFGVV